MNEKEFYEQIGNWDFSDIKYEREMITKWDMYEKIKELTNENSICLDLGTGGGEKVLKYYPNVKKVIGTDFSLEMIKTANKNKEKYNKDNVEFMQMDSNNLIFPNETFDLVSARHTFINAKQIFDKLKPGGYLVIEGIDKEDCIEIKDMFGRGQAYFDTMAISDIDYNDIKNAGFSEINKFEIIEKEYYKTKEDLLALLLKTPILEDFSEEKENDSLGKIKEIEDDILNKYIEKYKTEIGILLNRKLYAIIARK